MDLGISTWSLPWSVGVPGYPQPVRSLDVYGLIDTAVDHGIGVVQVADNLSWLDWPETELDRVKEAVAARNISLELGTRGLDPLHLTRCARVAERVGARALRTVLSGSMCGADDLAQAVRSIRQVVEELQEKRVILAVENNEAFSAAQYSQLMGDISSPVVGMCIDTANSLGRPELVETVVGLLGTHAVMVHAKDYDIKRVDTRMGFSVVGRPAGEGRVDFDAVLGQLRRYDRDDVSVIIEHWPPFVGTIDETVQLEKDWLARSIEFLRPRVEPTGVAAAQEAG
jgi:3-oxoisoapionate decarboxylase